MCHATISTRREGRRRKLNLELVLLLRINGKKTEERVRETIGSPYFNIILCLFYILIKETLSVEHTRISSYMHVCIVYRIKGR